MRGCMSGNTSSSASRSMTDAKPYRAAQQQACGHAAACDSSMVHRGRCMSVARCTRQSAAGCAKAGSDRIVIIIIILSHSTHTSLPSGPMNGAENVKLLASLPPHLCTPARVWHVVAAALSSSERNACHVGARATAQRVHACWARITATCACVHAQLPARSSPTLPQHVLGQEDQLSRRDGERACSQERLRIAQCMRQAMHATGGRGLRTHCVMCSKAGSRATSAA